MTEAQLHRAVAGYLSWTLAAPAWFSTFPAGGGGEMRGKLLRAAGLKAGVPDILIVFRGLAHWVELKNAAGRVSQRQAACHAELADAGCRVAVVRSIEDLKDTLDGWGIPMRTVSLTTERLKQSFAAAFSTGGNQA